MHHAAVLFLQLRTFFAVPAVIETLLGSHLESVKSTSLVLPAKSLTSKPKLLSTMWIQWLKALKSNTIIMTTAESD